MCTCPPPCAHRLFRLCHHHQPHHHHHNRALDKERLEGVESQGAAPNGRASVTGDPAPAEGNTAGGAAPAAVNPAVGRRSSAAGGESGPAAGGGGGGGGGSLPPIFRTRPSARFGAPKPRPLYAKLELLLDLAFRRLYFDPSDARAEFSADALLKAVRRADKELGP